MLFGSSALCGNARHRACASDWFCPALRPADFRHVGSDCRCSGRERIAERLSPRIAGQAAGRGEGINSMAKILMMAGSTIVVLSLLGFLVLLLKGRAVTKTSPVLMSLKAPGFALRGRTAIVSPAGLGGK